MSNTHDPLHNLQQAAVAATRHLTPSRSAGRVIVLDSSGNRVVDVAVPILEHTPTPGAGLQPITSEPKPGWDFTTAGPLFDGEPVAIRGRQLDVLRALAEAEGPLSVGMLRKQCWAGYPAEESTVRWTVNELRKTLKTLFASWEGDIISADGDGYTLTLR